MKRKLIFFLCINFIQIQSQDVRLMTFNFQSTRTGAFGSAFFEEPTTFDLSDNNIRNLLEKRDKLSAIVNDERKKLDEELQDAVAQLESKQKKLQELYQKQLIIVEENKKIVADLQVEKREQYDPIKKEIDSLQDKVNSLKQKIKQIEAECQKASYFNKVILLSQKFALEYAYKTASASLEVAKKSLDGIAYIQSKFSQAQVNLIASQAYLTSLSVGGEIYNTLIDPLKNIVEIIKDKGLSQVTSLPEFLELENLKHTLNLIRRELAIIVINEQQPDIICFQENNYDKFVFNEKLPNYALIDPQALSENLKNDSNDDADWNPIFYNKNQYKLLQTGVIWINRDNKPFSTDWGVNTNRTCTYAQFQDNILNKKFWVYNTHLDHRSNEARIEGLRLLATIIKLQSNNELAVLAGDLNMRNLLYSVPWIFEEPYNFQDGKLIAKNVVNQLATFIPSERTFDYFLLQNSNLIEVQQYNVIDYQIGGLTPSDHRAILLDF